MECKPKKEWLDVLPILIGLILFLSSHYLGDFISLYSLPKVTAKKDLGEFALGKEVQSSYASIDGYPIHCSDHANANLCFESWKTRGGKNVTLWLGNSQLHAINQFKQGDENAVKLLHRKLSTGTMDILAFSQPNASLQEHYVLFTYLISKFPIKRLILPLVFDDTRETAIRASIAEVMNVPFVQAQLQHSKIGQDLFARKLLSADSMPQKKGKFDRPADSIQEIVESHLNLRLNENISIWRKRSELRGEIYIFLYKTRNAIFRIDAQSKRKLLPGRYVKNLQSLEAILELAKRKEVSVLTYIAPIRNDIEIPYVETEYEQFKSDCSKLVNSASHSKLVNLERAVPATYWGTKASTNLKKTEEIDFMHFQAPGHEILATEIYKSLALLNAK